MSSSQVYITAAIAAFAGTALYKYFNQPKQETCLSEPVSEKSKPLSQDDITDLETQIADMERMVVVWHHISEDYPRDKEFASECIKDIEDAIKLHRDAIASVRNILDFQTA